MKKRFLFEEENVGAIYTTNPKYLREKEKYDKLYARYNYTIIFSICNSIIALIYTFWANLVCRYNLEQLALLNTIVAVLTIMFLIVILIQDRKLDKINYIKKFRDTEEYKKQVKTMQMTDKEKVELIFDVVDKTKKIKGKRQDKIDAVLKTMNKK